MDFRINGDKKNKDKKSWYEFELLSPSVSAFSFKRFFKYDYFIWACAKKSVNRKAFYDKIKKIIGGVFYV